MAPSLPDVKLKSYHAPVFVSGQAPVFVPHQPKRFFNQQVFAPAPVLALSPVFAPAPVSSLCFSYSNSTTKANWHLCLLRLSRCQISPTFYERFFVQMGFSQLFSTKILTSKIFGRKIQAKKLCVKCW